MAGEINATPEASLPFLPQPDLPPPAHQNARHGGAGATEEKTPGMGPRATEEKRLGADEAIYSLVKYRTASVASPRIPTAIELSSGA